MLGGATSPSCVARIVEDGTIHSQPFSEGAAAGATAGYSTRAGPRRMPAATG